AAPSRSLVSGLDVRTAACKVMVPIRPHLAPRGAGPVIGSNPGKTRSTTMSQSPHSISTWSRATDPEVEKIARRRFLAGTVGGFATTIWATAHNVARAQQPSHTTSPTARYAPHADPVRYPEPDVVVLDKRFAPIKISNTPIRRLHT